MSECVNERINDFILPRVSIFPSVLSFCLCLPVSLLFPCSVSLLIPAMSPSVRVSPLPSPSVSSVPALSVAPSTPSLCSFPLSSSSSSLPQYLYLSSVYFPSSCLSFLTLCPSLGLFTCRPLCPSAWLAGLAYPNPLPSLLMSRRAFKAASAGERVGP